MFSSLRPQLRLAGHAQAGPGNSLQPFLGDGLRAIAKDTIRPILEACQRLLYFGEQRFLIVQKSLIHVFFLQIHRLFFRLFNAIAGLDCIFGGRGASSQCRDMLLNFSLLLFKSLSHDSQVNCHLFVSFRRTVLMRENYSSFFSSGILFSVGDFYTVKRPTLLSMRFSATMSACSCPTGGVLAR